MKSGLKLRVISIVGLFGVSLISLFSSLYFLINRSSIFLEWNIFNINSSNVVGAVILDWISIIFMSFVCFISSIVLYYSGGYIRGDENIDRFLYLVLSFVLSIVFLIISPNLVSILLGWDGLGLVSYVLVIYYQNENSANAGILTVLSNRIGDVAILLSISIILTQGGWNFIFNQGLISHGILLLLLLGACTKRAQIPFSAWLPAAIAAPTPVSALVHSSTLVTAGVYLIIRFRPSLGYTEQIVLFVLGCTTTFISSLGAFLETDLKKIIALSTLSQLGLIITTLSLGWAELAFFHLLTHALFKALLFIRAGSIIHRVNGYQDVRFIGCLSFNKSLRVSLINLANLALCGTPFLAGFYSKDLILEIILTNSMNEFGLYFIIISTRLTVCYTFRLIYLSITGSYNLGSLSFVEDEDNEMTNPIMFLRIGGVMGGSFLSWLIFPYPSIICLPIFFKFIVLIVSILGGLIGYLSNIVSVRYKVLSIKIYKFIVFSGSMWFIPLIRTWGLSSRVLKIGQIYSHALDTGWFEYYGGQGTYRLFRNLIIRLQRMQDGNIKLYLLVMFIWLVVFLLLGFLGSLN